MIQLYLLNTYKPLGNFLAGNLHFLRIFMRLTDVNGEFPHTLVKATKILAQLAELILDDMHLLARLHIFHHRARGVQHGHQRGRRDDPHAPLHRVIHEVGMMRVDFGEHGFGGDEHHRAVGSHVVDDVFVGDVVHMFFYVNFELARGLRAFGVAVFKHAVIIFQREFGVHRNHAGRFRQFKHAVGAGAVRQRVLHFE